MLPFIQTVAEGVVHKALIQASMGSGTAIWAKVQCMKVQLTLRKAFSASVDNKSIGVDEVLALDLILIVPIILSRATLVGIKTN